MAKNKLKTHQATKKRYKITKGGKGDKVMHDKQGNNHLRRKKDSARAKRLKNRSELSSTKEVNKIKRLITTA